MSYVVGFDGGGTKTRVVLGDLNGNVLADIIGRGSNHQSTGVEYVTEVLEDLYSQVLEKANVSKTEIKFVYLGLSGADMPSDFEKLNGVCDKVFKNTDFLVVNDAWIIMRSGLKEPRGAVAICGTGTNSAAMNRDGKQAILRSLGFSLGIFGGGLDIAREALHYAFRADELTNKETILQKKIPELLDVNAMENVVDLFYPKRTIDYRKFGQITRLVFESANEGDEVCQEILIRVGDFLGKQTAGVIKQVNMQNEEVPVVIGGSVFGGVSPLLIDQFTTALHRTVSKAYIVKPVYPPVYGAYLGALDKLNIEQREEIDTNLFKSLERV